MWKLRFMGIGVLMLAALLLLAACGGDDKKRRSAAGRRTAGCGRNPPFPADLDARPHADPASACHD